MASNCDSGQPAGEFPPTNNIEFEVGSGNVFVDLGLANAEQLKIESCIEIDRVRAIRNASASLDARRLKASTNRYGEKCR
jgi:hypothetical protein